MIEDDVYRASSQYRYWSYTKQSLARIRQETNELASERVRAAFRRANAAKSAQNGSNDGPVNGGDAGASDAAGDIQTLTVEEELKIVEWGCSKIMEMGEAMNPRIPSHVVVGTSRLPPLAVSSTDIPDTVSGDRNPIPPPFLSHQFAHDLPAQADHDVRALSRHQSRPFLHLSS